MLQTIVSAALLLSASFSLSPASSVITNKSYSSLSDRLDVSPPDTIPVTTKLGEDLFFQGKDIPLYFRVSASATNTSKKPLFSRTFMKSNLGDVNAYGNTERFELRSNPIDEVELYRNGNAVLYKAREMGILTKQMKMGGKGLISFVYVCTFRVRKLRENCTGGELLKEYKVGIGSSDKDETTQTIDIPEVGGTVTVSAVLSAIR